MKFHVPNGGSNVIAGRDTLNQYKTKQQKVGGMQYDIEIYTEHSGKKKLARSSLGGCGGRERNEREEAFKRQCAKA